MLMDFAGLAVTASSSLRTLNINASETSAEVGDKFMRVLADHDIHSLENLTFALE